MSENTITSWVEVSENTIKNYFEKFGFGKSDVLADETVDHEFDKLKQEFCSDATVEKFLEFGDCVDTCEPVVNTLSVDWRQELKVKCIKSVINPNVESDDDGSDLEEDVDDAMEIDSKPAVNSGEALAMLDKLQLFFEENDTENKVLRSAFSLKKVEKIQIKSKKQKTICDFLK